MKEERHLRLLCFNDVYNIGGWPDHEPVGGAARFRSMLLRHDVENDEIPSLVLFSGDAFSPSVVSTLLKGGQMPPVLNRMCIDCAMLGNHDFDFGLSRCQELMAETKFPWLLSNAKLKKQPNKQMANAERLVLLEKNGIRIGLMGLIEHEWLSTLATLNVNDIVYTDFVEAAKTLSAELREPPYNADCVIALTHMRQPNDRRLAQEAGAYLDLILGGHDHHYEVFYENNVLVCKSGTDFKYATKIELCVFSDKTTYIQSHEKLVIDSSLPEDTEMKELVSHFTKKVEVSLDETIGILSEPLDARFKAIRTSETTAGNLVADVIRKACGSQCAILNSGTLRADTILPAGPFTKRDLVTLLPMPDELCVLEMSGALLLKALENGVSQWPRLEGRFPQVSGLIFSFDPSRDPGNRIVSLFIGSKPVDLHTTYTVAIKEFLRSGKDGYQMFKDCPLKLDAEHLPALQTILLHHFENNGLRTEEDATASSSSSEKDNNDEEYHHNEEDNKNCGKEQQQQEEEQQKKRIILLNAEPVPLDDD